MREDITLDRVEVKRVTPAKRCYFMVEQHIGLSIYWRTKTVFPLEVSLSLMCFTFVMGFGEEIPQKRDWFDAESVRREGK